MSDIISKNGQLFLSDKTLMTDVDTSIETEEKATAEVTKRDLCVYLKFTITLLDNAVNKEIYNSVEVCNVIIIIVLSLFVCLFACA
jgi:hypothetical protein